MSPRDDDDATPEEAWDDTSGAIEDPDARKDMRSRRSTARRLERLEDKHDRLDSTVTETRVVVGEIAGKVDGIAEALQQVATIHTERTVQDVKLETVRRATELEDAADAKKSRRALVTKIVGGIFSGAVVTEILHRLGVL